MNDPTSSSLPTATRVDTQRDLDNVMAQAIRAMRVECRTAKLATRRSAELELFEDQVHEVQVPDIANGTVEYVKKVRKKAVRRAKDHAFIQIAIEARDNYQRASSLAKEAHEAGDLKLCLEFETLAHTYLKQMGELTKDNLQMMTKYTERMQDMVKTMTKVKSQHILMEKKLAADRERRGDGLRDVADDELESRKRLLAAKLGLRDINADPHGSP